MPLLQATIPLKAKKTINKLRILFDLMSVPPVFARFIRFFILIYSKASALSPSGGEHFYRVINSATSGAK